MSAGKSECGLFKRNNLRLQQFLSSTVSIPDGFYSQKLWGLVFLALETWAGRARVRLGPLSPDTLPDFYLPRVGVGLACSVSLPLLPVSV